MSHISNIATEATVTIGNWEGKKFDREVTRATEERYQSHDSGRWTKALVAKSAIDKITKFESKVRKFVYENTLPWGKGRYLLLTEPVEHFQRFTAKMEEFDAEYTVLADEFCANYPQLIEEARTNLNGMFKERDYPTPDRIRSRFYFKARYYPIANADGFKLNVSNGILEGLRGQITDELNFLVDDAKRSMWEKMYKVAQHMVERLEPQDAIFRNSLVDNVRQLVDSLKVLNFDKDPEIEAMRQRMEEKLIVDPTDLRQSQQGRLLAVEEAGYGDVTGTIGDLRQQVAREARAIAGEIGRRLSIDD